MLKFRFLKIFEAPHPSAIWSKVLSFSYAWVWGGTPHQKPFVSKPVLAFWCGGNKNKILPDIEPQEVFLDNLAKKKEEELGLSEKKLETPLLNKFLLSFFLGILILFLALVAKSFQLQIIQREKFIAFSQGNWQRIYFIRPERGIIYDQNGEQLVFNRPSFDFVCDKRDLPFESEQRSQIIKEVSGVINEDFNDLRKKIEENENFRVLIKENLVHEDLILIETFLSQKESDDFACKIEENTLREYTTGEKTAHLIGYAGKISGEEMKEFENYSITDYIGKSGIEKSYEEILRGQPGIIQIEKDALGNEMSEKTVSLPQQGKNLVLWLDLNLQNKIIDSLKNSLKTIGASKAAALALNPKTGGVLALISLPGFDNNLFSGGGNSEELKKVLEDPKEPLFNRAVSGEYAVGSTIKPLIASAALEEGIISPEKSINCQGQIEIPHRYDPEITYYFRDWKVHGITDMRKAIAESSNVYFYTIGGGYENQEGLGPSRIKKYLELFGWGSLTDIDLPSEAQGFIPSPEWKKKAKGEAWWDGDTYHLSIGQGDILATPLQVAVSFAAIANGGKLLEPRVVKEIQSEGQIEPEILRENFIDSENLEVVREGMRDAVRYGSSVLLNSLPVKAAAKTGTAQTPQLNHYHNWITVFAPYEDPEIVLTLVIENVKDIQAAVLPVAREVLSWYFSQ